MNSPRLLTAIYCLVLSGALIAVTAVRFDLFHGIEPRMDHAFFIDWVQSVVGAERFFPERLPGDSLLAALEADRGSFLHVVLKPLYVAPTTLFTIVGLAWFAVGALLTGVSLESQVFWSILAQSGMLCLLGFMPLYLARPEGQGTREAIAVGALAVCVAAASSFLHAFSPLGVHNVGLLALVAAMFVVGRYLQAVQAGAVGSQMRLAAVGAQMVACYTMYTNVFLLPVATGIALLLCGRQGLRYRILEATRFSALTVIGFVPALLLLGVTLLHPHSADTSQNFEGLAKWAVSTGETGTIAYLTGNFFGWFQNAGAVFGYGGLALGFVGLVIFGVRYRQWLPLGIVGAHLLASTAMGGFAGQYNRTLAYVVPLLALGVATLPICLIQIYRARQFGARRFAGIGLVAVALAFGFHFISEWLRLVDPRNVSVWSTYYGKQGTMRAMVNRITSPLPDDAVLVPWDQSIWYSVRVLHADDRKKLHLLQPLETLYKMQQRGKLDAYLTRRRVSLSSSAPVYFLAPQAMSTVDAERLASNTLCQRALLDCHKLTVEKIGDQIVNANNPNLNIALYRVRTTF